MGSTRNKGERTRSAILDSAFRLFVEQGYAATSMRQIAARAGLAPGGLYNHFASKDEIFRAVLEERHPFLEILPALNEVQGKSVEEFTRDAAHMLVDQLGLHPAVANLMLIEIVEFKGRHVPSLFEKFVPEILPLALHIRRLEGHMRDIPPLVLARAFLGMFFSYYITGVLMGNAMPPEMQAGALDHFVDIFLHGVLEKETP